MADTTPTRRLAAILAADVVGYSRLMGADEAGTLAALNAVLESIVKPLLTRHNGRLVKLMGDGALAEFGSVVDAVTCAVAIQSAMEAQDPEAPGDRRIRLRIGVNLGDIIIENEDIFGDGVNVAARLEGLADPGGVCVSRTVADHVGDRAGVAFEDLGRVKVKNIADPVHAFRVVAMGAAPRAKPRRSRRPLVLTLIALIVLAAGAGFWLTRPDFAPADPAKMAAPLPSGTSIAVLPFDYLGPDKAENGYIADGLSENIISALARIPDTLVIARNSTFTYKGKAVDVREVSENFGVRYVLEGSVQLAGETIRVTAQLVDGIGGRHVWTDTYDRKAGDIFAVQDEITLAVANSIYRKTLSNLDITEAGTESLDAWAAVMKGYARKTDYSPEGLAEARKLFEYALTLDPDYSRAYDQLAQTYFFEARFGIARDPAAALELAGKLAEKALALDPRNYGAEITLAITRQMQKRPEEATERARDAVAAAPGDGSAVAILGWVLKYSGDARASLPLFARAKRIFVDPPWWIIADEFGAYLDVGDFAGAVARANAWIEQGPPSFRAHFLAVAAVAHKGAGDEAEAKRLMAEAIAIDPDLSISALRRWDVPYTDPAIPERKYAVLRQLGLPDTPPGG